MEWSERTALILGMPPGTTTASGAEFEHDLHPEDHVRVAAAFGAALAGDAPFHEEFRIIRPDGEVRWVRVEALLRRTGNGKPVQLNGAVRDTTDERRSRDALHQLNEELELRIGERTRERDRIWRLSRDIMSVSRLDSTLVAVNPAFAEMLGRTEADLVGRRAREFVHPDDIAATRREQELRSLGEATPNFENRLRRLDGVYRWISWTAVIADGLVYGMGRDVTEQKEAAEALAAAHRQLLAQIEERERVEVDAAPDAAAGGGRSAHIGRRARLQQPAHRRSRQRRVRCARHALSPDQERRLEMVRIAAERGANLTAQLLAFSRRQRLEPKPVDLNDVVRGMTDLLRSTLGGTVELEAVLAADLWPALVDQTQIELVILNLAINARDAMPDRRPADDRRRSNVVLAAGRRAAPRRSPGRANTSRSRSTDTGTGMAGEVRGEGVRAVLHDERGRQGVRSRASAGVRVRQAIGRRGPDRHAARLGTCVTVYLPRATTSVVADAARARGREAQRSRRPCSRAFCWWTTTTRCAKSPPRCCTTSASRCGTSAPGKRRLEALRQDGGIEVMLVDFAMPGMNGAEVARQAMRRSGPDCRSCSSPATPASRRSPISAKTQIMSKPFREDELRRKLEAAIGSSGSSRRGAGGNVRAVLSLPGS